MLAFTVKLLALTIGFVLSGLSFIPVLFSSHYGNYYIGTAALGLQLIVSSLLSYLGGRLFEAFWLLPVLAVSITPLICSFSRNPFQAFDGFLLLDSVVICLSSIALAFYGYITMEHRHPSSHVYPLD